MPWHAGLVITWTWDCYLLPCQLPPHGQTVELAQELRFTMEGLIPDLAAHGGTSIYPTRGHSEPRSALHCTQGGGSCPTPISDRPRRFEMLDVAPLLPPTHLLGCERPERWEKSSVQKRAPTSHRRALGHSSTEDGVRVLEPQLAPTNLRFGPAGLKAGLRVSLWTPIPIQSNTCSPCALLRPRAGAMIRGDGLVTRLAIGGQHRHPDKHGHVSKPLHTGSTIEKGADSRLLWIQGATTTVTEKLLVHKENQHNTT
ncbi:DNA damage-regulated autophagy modulator protein 2 [Platysternon megacephalum]|uniref:DNA damage-regulated autophagy modulator protein 2 n=1 Tax=Platysternon megacephalum TaxID=55544 RepID=A0A4D9DVJ1_9SAUR|nr:DNA damage-regulated autophagy modulator protein 2 [Platysternon megacephalum]